MIEVSINIDKIVWISNSNSSLDPSFFSLPYQTEVGHKHSYFFLPESNEIGQNCFKTLIAFLEGREDL